MIQFFLLAGWISLGLLSVPRLRAEGDTMGAVGPLAATFGPLWPAIALERRRTAVVGEP